MTAAAARKLQKDMDIALKKVDDGIDEFATVWEQATSATSNAQREKFGEELKRSINKLQRLRAQIREWISQSDIKTNCKDKLEDARRRIETDMQRFKEFERELKTKAFSTCALAKADELDVEEAERKQYQEWLTSTIQSLGEQLEELEADYEALCSKKNLNNDDKARQAQLKTQQDRHQWHTKKLELILRALDNETIDMSDLAVVRDSIEVYFEHYNEPEFPHDETLYDCFDLTEFEDKQVAVKPRAPQVQEEKEEILAQKEEPQKKSKEKERKKKDDKKDKKREEREKKGTTTVPAPSTTSKVDAKGAAGKTGDTLGPPAETQEKKVLEDLNPEETKVQEDQLLNEAEEFICKICQIHVVGCSPKLTNCSHLFCGDCIAQWFSQHPDTQTWAQRARCAGPERIVPCPVCKQPLNEKRDLYPVCGSTCRSENLLLWRMLSSLKIMCVNHHKIRKDGKCDWIGEYGQYQKHIASCNNLPVDGGIGADDSTKNSVAETVSPQSTTAPTPETKSSNADTAHAKQLMANAGQDAEQAQAKANPEPEPSRAPAPAPAAAPAKAAPAPAKAPPMTQQASQAAPAPLSAATPVSAPAAVVVQEEAPAEAPVAQPVQAAKKAQVQPRGDLETAKAVSAFEPTNAGTMTVAVGDTIQVLEKHGSGWSFCKNLTTNQSGWAPHWVIKANDQSAAEVSAEGASAAQSVAPEPQPAPVQQQQQATQPVQQPVHHAMQHQAQHPMHQQHQAQHQQHPAHQQHQAQHQAHHQPQQPQHHQSQQLVSDKQDLRVQQAHVQQAYAGMERDHLTAQQNAMKHQGGLNAHHAAAHHAHGGFPGANYASGQMGDRGAVRQQHASEQLNAASQKAPAFSTYREPVLWRITQQFNPQTSAQMGLQVNDLVEIIERHNSGWTYGRKLQNAAGNEYPSHPEGWFPDWVVNTA